LSFVRCCYCQQVFQPSRYRPQQKVCSQAGCQQRRRTEYHRNRIRDDEDYRQVCLDSPRKWRACHPDYWQKYRQSHPQVVERNRQKQRQRDRARRLSHLANNNLVFDLKRSAAEVYLLGPTAEDLANNTLAPRQVFVLETVVHQGSMVSASCQQQPSGANTISSG
jgi:hypothetical protein